MMRPLSIVALLALAVGCGGAGPTASLRRICDGSDDIRLAVSVTGGGLNMAFTTVLYELGYEFLYVDGHCHYWMNEPSAANDMYYAWRPFRQGVLTAAQEMSLHAVTSYDDLSLGPTCTPTETFDASSLQFWDGRSTSICSGNLNAAIDWPLRTELFAAANAANGAMRIVVGRYPVPPDPHIYPWVLANPPESYAIDYAVGLQAGKSTLIADAAEATALRSLRTQVISDATVAPGFFYGVIYVAPSGYVLAMRDDLPFTRPSDGLWAPPP
jgi:hypothetical protein